MKSTEEILEELRKGIILTGNLSSVHVQNLQTYPFICFDNIKSVNVDYNISTDGLSKSYVHYYVNTKRKKDSLGNKLKIRTEKLEEYVKALLWQNIEVLVFKNGGETSLFNKTSR